MTVPALTVYVQGQGVVSGDQLNTFLQAGAVASQLRTITGLPGMTVMLAGISTVDDGFGGFFFWNASGNEPDDNYNYITPQGTFLGQWTRLALPVSVTNATFNTLNVNQLATFAADVVIEGFLTQSISPNLSAAGTTQATAQPITSQLNVFTSVAAGAGGILPAVTKLGAPLPAGTRVQVFNRGAAVLSVYPPSGQGIETIGVNSPAGIAVNGNATYTYAGSAKWYVS